MTTFRPLTDGEILDAAASLRSYLDWVRVVGFARKWFGPEAYKVELHVEGDYDDENYGPDKVQSITVYGRDGKRLPLLMDDEQREMVADRLRRRYSGGYYHHRIAEILTDPANPDYIDIAEDIVWGEEDDDGDRYRTDEFLPNALGLPENHVFYADRAPAQPFGQLYVKAG